MDGFDPYDPPLIDSHRTSQEPFVRILHLEPTHEVVPEPVVNIEIPATSFQIVGSPTGSEPVQPVQHVPVHVPRHSENKACVASENLSKPKPTSTSSRRRTYEPDPIRGTSEHTEKRARNNEAVRKSRAKANEAVKELEDISEKNKLDAAAYREARERLTELMHRFKSNMFDRSPNTQQEQHAICAEIYRINETLRESGLEVPDIREDP